MIKRWIAIGCALFLIFAGESLAAEVIADMVAETSTTTGTGTLSLIAPMYGYQSFVSGIGGGNQCTYQIKLGENWEIGLGTVTDSTPDTLSRDTVYSSSNSGSKVNFSAGIKTVTCVLPAHDIDLMKNYNVDTDLVIVTGSQSLTAEQLTGSRVFYTGSGTSTFTLGSAQDAYELGTQASMFYFMSTNGAYFDPASGDKITFIDGTVHTMDDGDKMSALVPAKYDAFVIVPVLDSGDYQWMFYCVRGLYQDGGP